jgi:cell division protein FtsQ
MKKFLRILNITVWILLACGLVFLLGFSYVEHDKVVCKQYNIHIDYGNADTLVTESDIYTIVKQTGNLLHGQTFGYINSEKIERNIRKQPYVAKANVFLTIDGVAEIKIIQRQPILRIFNHKGESFYLDGIGNLLPLNPDFSARVMIANGFIPEPFSRSDNYLQDSIIAKDSIQYNSVMSNLFQLSNFIMQDPFLKALVTEIYVEQNGEFELIPRFDDQVILFGNVENMEDKFHRLRIFYKQGLNITGWNRYNVINIKYKNQVVCSKI